MYLMMQVTIWRDVCLLSIMVVMFTGSVGGRQTILVSALSSLYTLNILLNVTSNYITSFGSLK